MSMLRTHLTRLALVICCLFDLVRAGAAPANPVITGWGDNTYGQTNIPTTLTNAVTLVAGANFGVAVRNDGRLVAWGHNNVGQTSIPAAYSNAVAVAAGGGHALALRTNGTVVGWGYNASGEATPPVGLSNVVAIAAFGSHSLALKLDGTVVGWGDNADGETTIPAGLSNVVKIAAGHFHSLALKADGTVVAWGQNIYGQATVPAGLANVVAIAGGYYHSVALKQDGTMVAWGRNDYGQTNVPALLNNVVKIAAGYNHTLAVRADGSEVAWGDNSSKQANVPPQVAGAFLTRGGFYHSLALTGAAAPFVTSPSLAYTTFSGRSLRLIAEATGTPPLSYQWEINGAEISGATGPTIIYSPASVGDSGNIRVRVSNSQGAVTNLILNLTVIESAPLISQPVSQRIYPGAPASFSVTADGSTPISYQWQFNGVDIPGATSATLAFAATQLNQFGQYAVVVSNPVGAVTSKYVNLAVMPVVAWGRNVEGQTNVPVALNDAVAISAGANFGVALRRDSTVLAWGHNNVGQTNVPAGLTNVTAIASGGGHSIALKSDGTVVGWGYNLSGERTIPAGLGGVTAIAAFGSHSMALKNDGTVVGWGDNADGETNTPAGLNTVVKIAAGHFHSLALKGDGTVVAWGKNNAGQTNVPVGLANVVAIAGGYYHSMALQQDGTVVVWGDNTYGQRTVPPTLSEVVAISAGYDHCVAVKSDGTVVAWGKNDNGQRNVLAGLTGISAVAGGQYHSLALVNPAVPIISITPSSSSALEGDSATFKAEVHGTPPLTFQWQLNGVDIVGATNAVLTVANVALANAGNYSIKASNGQGTGVGAIGNLTVITVPPSVTAASTNQSIYPGGAVTFTVTAAGSPPLSYQWRLNEADLTGETNAALNIVSTRLDQYGRYSVVVGNPYGSVAVTNLNLTLAPVVVWGDNSLKQRQVPTNVGNVAAISVGANFTLGLRTNGTVVAWGDNNVGQTNVPVAASNVVALAAGGGHGVALRTNGTVVAWGYNASGEATPPSGLSNVVAIAAYGSHNLALKTDGSVVGWGSNGNGESTPPAGLGQVIKIAAGHFHSLALRSDRTVVAWGRNDLGQTNVPAGLGNVLELAGGYGHSLALKSDGTVVAWGENDFGQCNVPVAATNVVAVAAGYYHSLAVRSDGLVVVWGQNTYGQATVPAGLTNVMMIGGGNYHSVALAGAARPFVRAPALTQNVYGGNPLTLVADASGTFSVNYQWERDGVDLPGATGAAFSIPSLTTNDTGIYRVRAGNSIGVTTNLLVNLTVIDSAPLLSGPVSQRIYPGAPASLSVTAEGSAPISYQWQFNGVDIPGATGATLAFPATQLNQFGQYAVVVSNSFGAVRSAYVNLAVLPVVAWGRNLEGQTNVPAAVRDAVAISAGANFGLALRRDSTVTAWGHNNVGQTNVPTGLSNVTAIASGGGHSIALKSDGTVVGWGYNLSGERTIPTGLGGVTAIAAFGSHSMALKNDGTVVGWGDNADGETNTPPGLNTVVKIAVGHFHSLALKGDGTVVAWGKNNAGQTNVPVGLANVVQIAGGYYHSMALKQDGTVVAWGDNTYGQRTVPPTLSGVVAISAGYDHCLAVQGDGTVVAWGRNDSGQTNVLAGLKGISAVAGGQYHSLALVNPGVPIISITPTSSSVLAGDSATFKAEVHGTPPLTFQWQLNGVDIVGATNAVLTVANVALANAGNYSIKASNGQGTGVGAIGNLTVITVPPTVTAASTNQSIYPGGAVTFTVTAAGSPPLSYQWRLNAFDLAGQTNAMLNLPSTRLDQYGVYSVVVGNPYGSVTITNLNLTMVPVALWGDNSVKQRQAPATLSNLVAISVGANFTLGLRSNGTVVAWGDNNVGQTNVPVAASNVVALASGGGHGMALRSNGTLVAWGYNASGEAVPPAGLRNVVAIAAGGSHNLALKNDGTIAGWGSNADGESTPPAGLGQAIKITAGHFHSLALRSDRTVMAWGRNDFGQTNVPAGLTNVSAIAAGYGHSLALKSDGTVVAWGENDNGQCNVPVAATNVVAVAAGYYHSLALKADGRLVAWGQNTFGQVTVPAGLSNVVMAGGGYYHSAALTGAGTPFVLSPTLSRSLLAGQQLLVQANVSAAWPPSYQWLFNGAEIDTATNLIYTVASALTSNTGTYSVRVTNPAGSVTSPIAEVSVAKVTPLITWANPATISYGTPLGTSELNATSVTPGTFVYSPPAGTLLEAGPNQTLMVNFNPTDPANYNPASATASITVIKANQTISFGTLANKVYGDAPFTLTATASSGLSVALAVQSGPATLVGNVLTITGAGTVTVRATQTGNANYNAATSVDQSFTVNKAASVVTWLNPADIGYGAALGAAQLNASANVAGSFAYTPAAGTVPNAGNGQNLSVTFTPTDGANYLSATANVMLNVLKADQTITFGALGSKTYGDAPFAVTATASSGQTVSFSIFSGPGTVVGNTVTITGAGTVTVRATQGGNGNFNAAPLVDQSFTVNKAASVVTWSNPADIVFGAALGAGQLNATANVPGTYVYVPAAGTVLNAGAGQNLSVNFTPTDGANYNPKTANVSLNVLKADQSISFGTLANKVYGDAPFALTATASSGLSVTLAVLSGPATMVGNVLTITGAGTVMVRATQTGNANYNAATSVDQSFTVNKATPVVTWLNPADIVYGAALGAAQLNASANVAGSFAYTPSAGTVLNAGNGQNLSVTFTPTDGANYLSATANVTLNVLKADQTITFGALGNKAYGDAPFAVTATASSGQTVSFSIFSGPATVVGNTVTITGAGTVTVRATQGGNGNFNPAPNVDRTFVVGKASPILTWNNPVAISFGTALSGTQLNAGANVPGTFAYTPGAGTLLNPGTGQILSVDFTPTDTANYGPASTSLTINVLKAAQTISFGALAGKQFGNPPFTVQATASSGLPVRFSIVSGPASLDGSSLMITGLGVVKVRASQDGSANYLAADDVDQSFTVSAGIPAVTTLGATEITGTVANLNGLVNPAGASTDVYFEYGTTTSYGSYSTTNNYAAGIQVQPVQIQITGLTAGITYHYRIVGTSSAGTGTGEDLMFTPGKLGQTITFSPLADKIFGDAAFNLSATASSGLTPSFSIISGPATIAGNQLTITGAGTVVVRATQTGNGDFNPAPTVDRSFTVLRATQTINFGGLAGKVFGDAAFTLSATASSGLSPSFSVVSGPASVAGNTLTITGAGSVTVRAAQGGNANFEPALAVEQSFTVSKASQAITFNTLSDRVFGVSPFSLNATAGSGLAVVFSVTSGPASIAGNLLTVTGVGRVTVRAAQGGDANFNAATPVDQGFNVTKATPGIIWGTPTDIVYGAALNGIQLNANAGVPGSFAYTPAAGTVLNGGAGQTLSVLFTPTDTANYNTATAEVMINVLKANQTISFAALGNKTYRDAPFSVAATSSAGLPVTFSIFSGPATVDLNTITITGAGTITVRAAQAGNGNYNAATSVDQTFTVNKATPVVNWTNPGDIVFGTALDGVQLNATANVPGTFAYTPLAGTVLNAGNGRSLAVTFTPTDTANYTGATAGVSINVSKADQTISFGAPGNKTYGDAPFDLSATATSELPVEFLVQSGPATLAGSKLTITGAGTVTVRAAQAGNGNFNAAANVDRTFTVNKATPVVNWSNPADIVFGAVLGEQQLNATANVPGSFAYTPAAGTVLNAGNAQNLGVTFTPTDTVNYAGATANVAINVGKTNQSITFGALGDKTYGDAPFAVTATASSGLTVGFSIFSGPATVAGNMVTITGVGTVVVRASQAGNGNYNAAADADQSFSVAKIVPVINWTNPGDIVFGTALGAGQLNATASTPGTYAYVPAAGTVLNAGSQNLIVNFSPTDTVHYSAASTNVTLKVTKAAQTISFGALAGKNYDDVPFGISATASSGLPVSLTVHEGPAIFTGNILSLTGVGTVTIRASQAGSANYNAAEEVDRSFVISRAAPVLVVPGDLAIDELTLLQITNTASDFNPEPHTLVFSLENAPVGASIDPATGVLTWTPTEAQGPGVFSINVTVSDPETPGLRTTRSLAVTVNEKNLAPVLTPVAPKTINQGTLLRATNLVADADLPANHLTFTLLFAPAGAEVSPEGVVTWAPAIDQAPGNGIFSVKVQDDGSPSLSATNNFVVNVRIANALPLLGTAGGAGSPDFGFSLLGEAGRVYEVQVSTNLTQWIPFMTITNVDGQMQFTETNAIRDFNRRYYRTRRQDVNP